MDYSIDRRGRHLPVQDVIREGSVAKQHCRRTLSYRLRSMQGPRIHPGRASVAELGGVGVPRQVGLGGLGRERQQ